MNRVNPGQTYDYAFFLGFRLRKAVKNFSLTAFFFFLGGGIRIRFGSRLPQAKGPAPQKVGGSSTGMVNAFTDIIPLVIRLIVDQQFRPFLYHRIPQGLITPATRWDFPSI